MRDRTNRWRAAWFFAAASLLGLSPAAGGEKGGEQVSHFYGSFGTSISIEVPAYHGLEPRLALSYSSEGRNGQVGVGWTLSGLSTIERDKLDGQDLLLCSSYPPAPGPGAGCQSGGAYYFTKDESYLKIQRNGAGPYTYTVTGRDGTRTTLSPVVNHATASGAYRYGQTSVVDTSTIGNVVTYGWTAAGLDDAYPSLITYNGFSVAFYYESRPDALSFDAFDHVAKTLSRLKTIAVRQGTNVIRAYKLDYATSAATGRSLLTSVQVIGKPSSVGTDGVITGGTALPAQTFAYQNDSLANSFVVQSQAPTPPGTTEPVAWTNIVNVVPNGNNLTKPGDGENPIYNAGATSNRMIVSGDGYAQFTANGTLFKVAGLATSDSGTVYSNMQFALGQDGWANTVTVYELGVSKGTFPAAPGDVLRIQIESGVVRYKRNGSTFYTSAAAPVYPLLVDTALPWDTNEISNAYISGSLTSNTAFCASPYLRTGDFNGDGRTDLFCVNPALRVALANPAGGFHAPVPWSAGIPAELVGDFNNDGKTDIAQPYYYEGDTSFFVALSTGSGFEAATTWGFLQYNTCWPYVGDFNGDGFKDIWCRGYNGLPQMVGVSNGSSFSFANWGNAGTDDPASIIDINGDWKDDWVSFGSNLYVFRSTGSSFQNPSSQEFWCDQVLGDVNGDGRTDIACMNTGDVYLGTSQGAFVVGATGSGAFCEGTTDRFAADLDGDGKSEIICNKPGEPADDIQVRKWTGTALGAPVTWLGAFCSASLQLGDFNGDGKTDITCANTTGSYAVAGTGSWQADLLASSANGLGGTVTPTYASSAGLNQNSAGTKWTVSRLARSDGRGGTSTTDYWYSGGLMNYSERKFMGFHWASESLPLNPGETLRPYNMFEFMQDPSSAGKIAQSWRATGAGVYLENRGYQYTTNGTALPRKSLLTGESAYTYDGTGNYCSPCASSKATYATHSYDAYGNRTQTINYGDYYAPGDEVTSTASFTPNTTAWIVDRVAQTRVFAGIGTGGTKLSEQTFHYDNWQSPPTQGYLTAVGTWINLPTSRYVYRTMQYDAWGNPTVVTDETNRSVTTGWDTTYHVFPTSVTNGASETVSTVWDPICGVPTSTTNANSQTTTFAPADGLCRPTTTTDPLGGFQTQSYPDLGSPNLQRVRVETPSPDGSGNDYSESWFDGFGRTWKTVKKGPSPNEDILSLTTFYPRGGVATQTEPHYANDSPQRTTSYTYDALNRVVETELLQAGVTLGTVSYNVWNQTATDENGKSVTTRFDAYGRQKQVERTLNGGPVYTNYSYDGLGRLTGMTDHLGHAWSWTFDSASRNLQKSDPDAGTWNFQYDDAGRLAWQTDAKSQTTGFDYDAVGRLTVKQNGAGTVTTNYSQTRPGFSNVGLPTTITDPSSVLTLDYDAVGRVVKQARTLDAANYVLTRTYDSGGYLRGITYPDGDQVGTLGYDSAGRLKVVPGIVNSVTYYASGQPWVQTNANTTVTTRTYSPTRGFLTAIETTPGSPKIQDLHYTMDTAGLVGLVSEVTSPHDNEGWSYGYDDLYRLTSATNTSTPAESQSWIYDAIGRIEYNSRVGNYSYPGVGQARPHAPLTAGPHSFTSYDNNGNLVVGAGRTLAWDANNRIAQATLGATTTSFTYDGDGERLKKTTGANVTRYPVGDDYEIASDGTITKYIRAERLGALAKRVGLGPGAQTFWLHADRLGSINVTTSAAGVVVERRAYRPYGEAIGPESNAPGWIGERTDTETDLTYLHARYYDPAVGIFVSPDPIGVAGGLNLYGYGLGNPVNGADKTGLLMSPCEGINDPYCHYGVGGGGGVMGMGMGDFMNAVFAPGGGIVYGPLAAAEADWETRLIADGHGGAYTYMGADGETRVTVNPIETSRTESSNYVHLETGLTISIEWTLPTVQVARDFPVAVQSGQAGVGVLSGEAGQVYVLDPATGQVTVIDYLGGGFGLGAGFSANVEVGLADLDDPSDLASWGLSVGAFAAAGSRGAVGSYSGNSWFGNGAWAGAVGAATGRGFGVSGMLTHGWVTGQVDIGQVPADIRRAFATLSGGNR